METDLSKSIGSGIVVTLITNLGGVSAPRAAIIGASVILFVRSYIWASNWIKHVDETLSTIDSSKAIATKTDVHSSANSSVDAKFIFNMDPDSILKKVVTPEESNTIVLAGKYEDKK